MKDVLKKKNTTESQSLYDLNHLTSYNETNKDHKGFFGIPYVITECYNTNHSYTTIIQMVQREP